MQRVLNGIEVAQNGDMRMSDIEIGSEWVQKKKTPKEFEVVVLSGDSLMVKENGEGFSIPWYTSDFLEHHVPKAKADMVNHPPHYKDASGVDNTFNDDIALQTFGELPVRKMRLIGIAGKARSGKDTTAKYLLNKLGGNWSSASFADPMKAMLGVIGVNCSDAAKDLPSNQYGVSTRHMLQTLGTEWGRNGIGSDFWIDVFEMYNAGQCVIVPDVRFENEAELIRKYGVLIHVQGRGGISGNHVSEKSLPVKDGDIVIDNDGSLSEFYSKINEFVLDSEVNDD